MRLGNLSVNLAVNDLHASRADESTTGPAYLMLSDPDGNPILIDQHVASPKK